MEILHYARLPWPTPWPEIFGRRATLLLEIGFGNAQFLVDLARKRPSANVLGLEISLPSLRKGARKVNHAGLRNARVLQGDAKAALWLLCAPQSLGEVYVNFPDPWPKERHHGRRLIDDGFLHLLATRVVPGAPLDIATDHADYAAVIAETLTRSPYFDSRVAAPFVTEDRGRLRTKYEQIALDEGRTCRYFKWRRNHMPTRAAYPILREYPMPHVVMRSPLALSEIAARFAPWHVSQGDTIVKYLEMYQSTADGKLLVETYVNEEPFHQRLALAIRPRAQGDCVVDLHDVGFPRPTQGVHLAVHHLVAWLRTLHPETTISNSTLNIAPENS